MSRYHSYLNSVKAILSVYNGEEPFASFSKKYFAQHKKFGSKDRKQISHLCYSYFRLGKAGKDSPKDEKVLIGLFLCSSQTNELLNELKPEWNSSIELSIEKKLSLLNRVILANDIFPFTSELSEGIEPEQFSLSHLQQPRLFLRIRPGKEISVKQKLQKAGIAFDQITNSCIAFTNSTKIEEIIELNSEAVVQDYNSQRVAELLHITRHCEERSKNLKFSVWDCCAASGGKSIIATDVLGDIDLTASDIRESILVNLKNRFKAAGIKKYNSFVADLATPGFRLKNANFDLIICDAPCTGSGTWSRTPEQLYYFEKNKIDYYASLQKKIVSVAIPYIKPGGYFLYITCSVFKTENEEVVESIRKDYGLQLLRMEVLKGYDMKADTMFAALLQKPL